MMVSKPTVFISLLVHVLLLALLYCFAKPADLPEPPKSMQAVLMAVPASKISAQSTPAKPTTAVAKPQPEPKPEPTPKPVPEPTPKPTPKIEPKAKPEPAPKVEPATKAKADPVLDIKPPVKKPVVDKKPVKPHFDDAAFDKEIADVEAESQRLNDQATKRKRDADAAAKVAADAQARLQAEQIGQYMLAINKKIKSQWRRPASVVTPNLVSLLRITVLPGGEVASVVIQNSSGNEAFDVSAKEAVARASPLPVPSDAVLFREQFKVFMLKYKSEN